MNREWTFGQKVAGSIGLIVVLAAAIAVTSFAALRGVVAMKDQVIDADAQVLIGAQRVSALAAKKTSAARGFLLAPDQRLLRDLQSARDDLMRTFEQLRQTSLTDEGRQLLTTVVQAEETHQRALDAATALRQTAAPLDEVVHVFDEQVLPARDRLDAAVLAFVARGEERLASGKQASTDRARRAINLSTALLLLAAVCAVLLGVVLTRAISRQIGTAVGQVQSSSAELQAAATQQATGAKEQATAMSEIATTISELLATSRQITDSAKRVAQIAEETAAAARDGGHTVDRGQESVAAIRRQMDLIVGHMLELGRKSQQIGSVLELVSEMAEQTNILAINASIEAAGAGDSGSRFGVVADEIRKLADRVGGSTKEIRALIDEVRSAVNTTVMATEAGSKAVDTGAAQFGQITTSFKHIVGLVTTTTDAAREIELSIKQQMSAVEQVNVAITNIAQVSKETEASTGQTQQTASQLALLSRDLMRVIRPEQAA